MISHPSHSSHSSPTTHKPIQGQQHPYQSQPPHTHMQQQQQQHPMSSQSQSPSQSYSFPSSYAHSSSSSPLMPQTPTTGASVSATPHIYSLTHSIHPTHRNTPPTNYNTFNHQTAATTSQGTQLNQSYSNTSTIAPSLSNKLALPVNTPSAHSNGLVFHSHHSSSMLKSLSPSSISFLPPLTSTTPTPAPRLQFHLPVALLTSHSPSHQHLNTALPSSIIELVLTVSVTGSDHSRVIHLRLDNPSDPTFLFLSEISATTFQQLLTQNKLNGQVTFENMVTELEHHVRKVQEGHTKSIQEWEWTLICQFPLHSNEFGYHELSIQTRLHAAILPFWSLPFKPATDSQVKQFMLEAWNAERDTREEFQSQVTLLTEKLNQIEQTLDMTRQRLQQVDVDHASALVAERLQSDRALLDERTRHAKVEADNSKSHEAALNKQAEEYQNKYNQLNQLHETLQKEFTTCESEKNMCQNKLTAVNFELAHLQSEVQTVRVEKEELRTQLHQAQEENSKQTHALTQLQRQCDQFESAVKANEKYLLMVQEGGNKELAARQLLEESLANLKRDLFHLTEKHQNTVAEFGRGQETLTKLQTRLKDCKNSLQQKREMILSLEKKVESQELELRDAHHKVSDLNRDIVLLTGEKSRLEAELDRSQKQTKEFETELANRIRMFEALSNERTAQQISSITTPTFTSALHSHAQPTTFNHHHHHTSLSTLASKSNPALSTFHTPLPPSATIAPRLPVSLDFDSPTTGSTSNGLNRVDSAIRPTPPLRFDSSLNHPLISSSTKQHLAAAAAAATATAASTRSIQTSTQHFNTFIRTNINGNGSINQRTNTNEMTSKENSIPLHTNGDTNSSYQPMSLVTVTKEMNQFHQRQPLASIQAR